VSAAQDKDRSLRLAASVAIDLRLVLQDARAALEEFEAYVDDWDTQVQESKDDPAERDPRAFSQDYVVQRALEMTEELEHVHSGSTRASRIRTLKRRLVQLAQAAPQH